MFRPPPPMLELIGETLRGAGANAVGMAALKCFDVEEMTTAEPRRAIQMTKDCPAIDSAVVNPSATEAVVNSPQREREPGWTKRVWEGRTIG